MTALVERHSASGKELLTMPRLSERTLVGRTTSTGRVGTLASPSTPLAAGTESTAAEDEEPLLDEPLFEGARVFRRSEGIREVALTFKFGLVRAIEPPLAVAARPRLRTASPICVAAAARSCVVCGGLVVAPPVVGCVCCCCCSCCPISQERNEVTSRASEVLRLVVPERVDAS